MKRTRSYEINHLNNTVTVTSKFLDAATQFNSPEYKLINEFKALNLTIIPHTHACKKSKKKATRTLKNTNLPILTYAMMNAYIVMLDDANEMLKEFEQIKAAAVERHDRVQYVNSWFRATFPHYDDLPTFDDNFRIIHDNAC